MAGAYTLTVTDGNGCTGSAVTNVVVQACGQPPDQPFNVSPGNGDCVKLPVTLTASAFHNPGNTHNASQWQVRASTGSYANPIFDSGWDPANLTSITVPGGILSPATTYYWRVRYQNSNGEWSPYSNETYFCTENTPAGWNVTVTQNGVTITYSHVITSGCTFVTTSNSNPDGPLPGLCALLPFFDISTTATYGTPPPLTVMVAYDESRVANEDSLKLFHLEGGQWVDVTTLVDKVNNVIYGQVTSFSPFCVGHDCGGVLSGGVPAVWGQGLALVEAFLDYFVGVQYSFTSPQASTGWQWAGQVNSLVTNKGWAVLDDLVTIIHNTLDMVAQFSLTFPASGSSGTNDMDVLRVPFP
jgi:hypothetical protein